MPGHCSLDMRDESAVVEIAKGMRYVTRHAECRDVLRDTETFSNASGMKAPGVEIPVEDRLLGELDPPRHTRVRRVMVTALAPKVVHAAEAFMRATAERLLDDITGPTADLVPAFTVPAPQPRDAAPARPRSGRRAATRGVGQGPDGEHLPRDESHRARRRLRRRVSRVRGVHRRAHRRTHGPARAAGPRPTTCSPGCSNSTTTGNSSRSARCARSCGT